MVSHITTGNGTYIITIVPETAKEHALLDEMLLFEKPKKENTEKQLTFDDLDNAWKPLTADNPFESEVPHDTTHDMDASPKITAKRISKFFLTREEAYGQKNK